MAIFKDVYVLTCAMQMSWDGITTPKPDDRGVPKWEFNGLMSSTAPELAELQQIATNAVAKMGAWGGVLPPNGKYPIKDAEHVMAKFGQDGIGKVLIKAATKNQPDVRDASGRRMQQMEYAGQFYAGCIVKIVVNAYTFDLSTSKGVTFGLEAIQIIDSDAPKLAIAGGLGDSEIAGLFGGAPVAPVPPAPVAPVPPAPVAPVPPAPVAPVPPAPVAPVPPAPDFVKPVINQMTAAAGGATYESFVAAGWSDDAMRTAGYLL